MFVLYIIRDKAGAAERHRHFRSSGWKTANRVLLQEPLDVNLSSSRRIGKQSDQPHNTVSAKNYIGASGA